jgi:hypothetical protein
MTGRALTVGGPAVTSSPRAPLSAPPPAESGFTRVAMERLAKAPQYEGVLSRLEARVRGTWVALSVGRADASSVCNATLFDERAELAEGTERVGWPLRVGLLPRR